MNKILFASLLVGLSIGCAQVRYAETAVGQAIDNPVTQTYDWGEVHCGRCFESTLRTLPGARLTLPCTTEPTRKAVFKSL